MNNDFDRPQTGSTVRGADRTQMIQPATIPPITMRTRARQIAFERDHDSRRYTALAERLTPEIEETLWCLNECVALGLMNR